MGSVWAERVVASWVTALALTTLALAFGLGCARGDAPGDADVARLRRFSEELPFRRAALEQSLAEREDGDARTRLAHYAVAGEWEALPELNPELAPVVRGQVPALSRLWSGRVDWTPSALLALGKRAFEEWPAQRLPQALRWLGAPPAAAASGSAVSALTKSSGPPGAWIDDRGRVGGLVWVRYADGTTEPALSCSSCHARTDHAGRLIHGPPSDLDLGSMVGESWGAGHVDVTADGRDNPVSVPDLRATRHQRRLHHAGNVHNGLEALAVRTETLLITARSNVVRPPREIAAAIAYYVWSLGGAQAAPVPSPLFRQRCGGCHSGPTGAGELVSAAEVGTDPAAADSPARGSGAYRVPSLYRVSERARLTHLGWSIDLETFLSPGRLPAQPGHAFGLDLGAAERAALVRELRRW